MHRRFTVRRPSPREAGRRVGRTVYAGVALSAAGHAAVVALAVWGLPWLRVRPEPPVPAVMVSVIGEAEFAALSRGAPRPAAPEAPAAPPTPPPPPRRA